jgi:hypothetical protein
MLSRVDDEDDDDDDGIGGEREWVFCYGCCAEDKGETGGVREALSNPGKCKIQMKCSGQHDFFFFSFTLSLAALR